MVFGRICWESESINTISLCSRKNENIWHASPEILSLNPDNTTQKLCNLGKLK